MTYTELLTQREWLEKCNHILQRDKHRCQDCGNIGYHNSTVYVTESLDEIDALLTRKFLLEISLVHLLNRRSMVIQNVIK